MLIPYYVSDPGLGLQWWTTQNRPWPAWYLIVGKFRTRKNGKMLKEMMGGEWRRLWAREGLSEIAHDLIQVEVDLALLSSFWPGAFIAKSQGLCRSLCLFYSWPNTGMPCHLRGGLCMPSGSSLKDPLRVMWVLRMTRYFLSVLRIQLCFGKLFVQI